VSTCTATLSSEAETRAFARELALSYQSELQNQPVVFLLSGELASGKTRFAAGIGEAFGITAPMPSPSYVLCREYTNDEITLYHLDLWRLEAVDPEQLGFSAMLKPHSVLVIEWPEKISSYLATTNAVVVEVQLVASSDQIREVTVQ
jgi:tRNA threonylcarbamoyladenosine biosynthesis protein TsaE